MNSVRDRQSLRAKGLAIIATFVCAGQIWLLMGCDSQKGELNEDFGAWLGESANADSHAQVDGSHTLEFPRDHWPHKEFLTEWWYVTSTLATSDGRKFGVQFTLFRRSLSANIEEPTSWRTGQVYMAHAALSDVKHRKHYDFERISREHTELAGVDSGTFRAFLEDWSLESKTDSFFPLTLRINTEAFEVDLQLVQTKPIVLQGDDGFSRKSSDHASYYYSIPRMATTGKLSIGSRIFDVSGTTWMDREWSSGLLGRQYEGWYWFSISLDDNRDLVVFSLRDRETGLDGDRVATWIFSDGSTAAVSNDLWSIEPLRKWKQWPVEWNLSIENEQFLISALFDNQEMNTSIPYWEGMVEILQGERPIGSGYMELTGYSPRN